MISNQKHKSEGSVILYGVPKVGYSPDGCTPYPMCLKAVANYLGQDIDMNYTMLSTGAAFRLTWDTTSWNGGNVDIIHTFDESSKVYQLGVEALGREFRMLIRKTNPCDVNLFSREPMISSSDNKIDFTSFIKTEIDKGNPCIALGIIGPPEACIITGYKEKGSTLLGWNFFQDSSENAADVSIDESGYFITNKWWENRDTTAVIALADVINPLFSSKEIIKNAIEVLTGRNINNFTKGILAYDAWKTAILKDSEFSEGGILPLLAERLMCQGDAMDCLADGRRYAAKFMNQLSVEFPTVKEKCLETERLFNKVVSNIWQMADVLGGYARSENQMRNFAKKETRQKISRLIEECKDADAKALANMTYIHDHM